MSPSITSPISMRVSPVEAREAMVLSQLQPSGVTAPALVKAFLAVPREQFVEPASAGLAYAEAPLRLGGRMMLPPLSLGLLLQALQPVTGPALVIGGGRGYGAAVLAAAGARPVVAVEEEPLEPGPLPEGASLVHGRLADGWPAGAPYAMMLIEGLIEEMPPALVDQLADDGRVAALLLDRGVSRVALGRKAGARVHFDALADAPGAPLPGFSRPRGFAF